VCDLVSVSPEIFNGDSPGLYSKEYPDRTFGTVKSITLNGIAAVIWGEDGTTNECKDFNIRHIPLSVIDEKILLKKKISTDD
jgi:hypothetical protein